MIDLYCPRCHTALTVAGDGGLNPRCPVCGEALVLAVDGCCGSMQAADAADLYPLPTRRPEEGGPDDVP